MQSKQKNERGTPPASAAGTCFVRSPVEWDYRRLRGKSVAPVTVAPVLYVSSASVHHWERIGALIAAIHP